MPSVLITRPRATAEPLAKELEQLGYRTVIEPLLDIKPLATPRPRQLCDAVMITSANALAALEVRRMEIADLLDQPCFCVGPRTAAKAAAFGFGNIHNTESDGAELAQLIIRTLGNKASVLHIAARDTDSKAHSELEKHGLRVAAWHVYEAIPVSGLSPATQGLLRDRGLDAVVVFSPRTAETLAALLSRDALETCCPQLAAICLSPAVAGVLQPFPWRQLVAAPVPAEQSVIARLKEICPVIP